MRVLSKIESVGQFMVRRGCRDYTRPLGTQMVAWPFSGHACKLLRLRQFTSRLESKIILLVWKARNALKRHLRRIVAGSLRRAIGRSRPVYEAQYRPSRLFGTRNFLAFKSRIYNPSIEKSYSVWRSRIAVHWRCRLPASSGKPIAVGSCAKIRVEQDRRRNRSRGQGELRAQRWGCSVCHVAGRQEMCKISGSCGRIDDAGVSNAKRLEGGFIPRLHSCCCPS